MFNFHYAQF